MYCVLEISMWRLTPRCKTDFLLLILAYVFLCTKLITNYPCSSSSFESVVVIQWQLAARLAALDLRAGFEKPFHCLVVQNRQSCAPWGGRRIGQWRTPRSTVSSSAPHSQIEEAAISCFCKQERKCPTPGQRRLSRTQAVLGRVIPGWWVPMSGMKMGSLVVFINHFAFHLWSAQSAARLLLSSHGMMGYCSATANGCLNLRCSVFLPGPLLFHWH